jgi:drug/metabolite transporter (DMT)-like permease
MTILANVFYHIFQKSTPKNVNPLISLSVTYFTAFLLTLIALPFYPHAGTLTSNIKQLNFTSVALGCAIVFLELGFLLAYRAGWNVSTAAIFSNVVVAILLIPIGMIIFKEPIKPRSILGLVVCISGLVILEIR